MKEKALGTEDCRSLHDTDGPLGVSGREDLPAALRAAALALVTERGPRGFSLAEAARRAGVSGSAPYRHFADRDALLAAVATDAYDDLAVRLGAVAAKCGAPGERLARMGAAYVAFAADRPAAFAVLVGAGLDKARYPAMRAAGDRAFAEVVAAARDADDARRLGAERALATTLWAIAHGHATLLVSGEFAANGIDPATVPEATAAAIRALLVGLAADGAAGVRSE